MKALNGISKSRETFELIRQNLGEKVRLHCGFIGNDIASALVTIRHKQTVEYFTPVSAIAYRHQQVLPHLVAEVMLIDSQSGATRWNWGGTWESQHGVKHFKSRFGTTDRPYRYFHWSTKRISEAPAEQILKEYPYWYVRRF